MIPVVTYPLLMASIVIAPEFYDFMMRKEGGIEYLAVLLLVIGIGYGVTLLARYRNQLPRQWLVWWFVLAVAGMFVFAGEEISWGQHLGFWTEEQVPEAIKAINDQNETNLHNISNVLDQGPTNLIVAGTFLAYVLLPLHLRRRGETMQVDNPGYWFWPTRAGLLAAIGVLIIPFPKRIYEWTTGEDGPGWLRHSELHEFYIALLMTIYIVSVFHRARALARHGTPPQQAVEESTDTAAAATVGS